MSFTNREYKSWRPNKSFVQFFENMKKRRIPASDTQSARVTNTSPPGESMNHNGNNNNKKRNNGYTPAASENLVRTAKAQMGYKKNRTKRHTLKPAKKRGGRTSLEQRLKKARL